jgi:hypothetical protein
MVEIFYVQTRKRGYGKAAKMKGITFRERAG